MARQPQRRGGNRSSDVDREELVTVTPQGRVCYPSMWETKMFEGEDTGKFGLMLVFEPGADISDLERIAKNAAYAKFGEEEVERMEQSRQGFRWPWRYCDEYASNGEPFDIDPDAYFINLTSKEQPGLVDENNNPIIRREQFYAGCWAHAEVYAHAYDTKGNQGVTFFVNHVQKTGDGPKLGGTRGDPKQVFKPIPRDQRRKHVADDGREEGREDAREDRRGGGRDDRRDDRRAPARDDRRAPARDDRRAPAASGRDRDRPDATRAASRRGAPPPRGGSSRGRDDLGLD